MKKGFTLIEVMIIISIFGILLAIIITQIKKDQDSKAGIVEQKDYSVKDAKQVQKSKIVVIRYEKHCIEGYIFIANIQSATMNQLIDSSGNGVVCEDVKDKP